MVHPFEGIDKCSTVLSAQGKQLNLQKLVDAFATASEMPSLVWIADDILQSAIDH